MSDIGKDLQNAYNEGYEKCKQDMLDEGYVKVTRCKDCKFLEYSLGSKNRFYCLNGCGGTTEDDYCSWAEPKS